MVGVVNVLLGSSISVLLAGCGAPKQSGPGLQVNEHNNQIIPAECQAACPKGSCVGSGDGPERGVVGSGSCGLVTEVRHQSHRVMPQHSGNLFGQVVEREEQDEGYGYDFEDDPLEPSGQGGMSPLALCIDIEGGRVARAYTRDAAVAGTGGRVEGRIEAGRWYELMYDEGPSGYRFRIDGARFDVQYDEHQLVGGCRW